MSGGGAPTLAAGDLAGAQALRVAVAASTWHAPVMDGLVAGALRALESAGSGDPFLVRVPGAFELPVVVARLAGAHGPMVGGPYDAVVALGVVIRGGTPHFDYVCSAATEGLARVALDTGVPVGFGLLTCDDEAQAMARAGLPGSVEDKGHEAAQAALRTALVLRELGGTVGR